MMGPAKDLPHHANRRADGRRCEVRTFDDMFSAFATQGIESKKKGEFTREELAPIAEVNVTSLKEYDFFTYAKANGTKQAEFYRQFSGLIRASKASGSAAWSLFGLSFFYGIFHAAGPGHGKAVISSYLVANEETWRRGVVLSFASALIQPLVAVAVVGVAAALLNATAATMKNAVNVIETVSYALIIVKFRDCVGSERGRPRPQ
jgi:hypothetical protein